VIGDHADDAGRTGGVEQLVGLLKVVAHGLLDQHVLAGADGVDGGPGVVRREHEHGIYVGLGQHVTVVGIGVGDAVFVGYGSHGAGRDVAEGSDFELLGKFMEMRQVHDLGNHACADQAYPYSGLRHSSRSFVMEMLRLNQLRGRSQIVYHGLERIP